MINYRTRILYVILLVVFSVFPFVRQLSAVEGLTTIKKDLQVITVGGTKADIAGYSSRAIQIAADALKANGGGTIMLSSGRFEISAPVRLYSNINLIGSGKTTVLHKIDGFKTDLIIDADYGMLKVTVKDPLGFKTGMGIQVYDNAHKGCWDFSNARITSIDDKVLYFDTFLVRDYQAQLNGVVTNACSIVEAIEAENLRIADFVVDGNGSTNTSMSGCVGGGIYLHKARNIIVENVIVRNYNGDGFSWQITENITVRNCESAYGFNLGFHPGTGSDNSVIENCISHHNAGDGIFLCWRVQNGTFRNNKLYANGRYGISIGHKDTDNLFENNHIYENKQHGVYFRVNNEENSGHRNTFRSNIIENNGSEKTKAYGFYIDGITHDITIENNTIRSTGKGSQTGAVFIGTQASRIRERNNKISGHPGVVKGK